MHSYPQGSGYGLRGEEVKTESEVELLKKVGQERKERTRLHLTRFLIGYFNCYVSILTYHYYSSFIESLLGAMKWPLPSTI